jgi:transposase-like protein
MSKIPQGEWDAIAARYAQGESISRIAQTYGCTPPAIHYILKRNRQRTAQRVERPLNGRSELLTASTRAALQTPPAPPSRSAEPRREEHGAFRPVPSEIRASPIATCEPQAGRDHGLAPATLMQQQPREAQSAQEQPGTPRRMGGASAFTGGLDSELHGRAEAAIEAFRSSFDAALLEGSPIVRQRLRQAASDLMRVAARTTIVLDRLNANAERASSGTHDHLRSARAGEHS